MLRVYSTGYRIEGDPADTFGVAHEITRQLQYLLDMGALEVTLSRNGPGCFILQVTRWSKGGPR